MRTLVVALGLAVIVSSSVAAQAPPQAPEKLTVTPAPAFKPRLDFGLEQAEKNLPLGPWKLVPMKPEHALPMQPSLPPELAPPIDCKLIKKHRSELVPSARIIELAPYGNHSLKTVTAPPCPVR